MTDAHLLLQFSRLSQIKGPNLYQANISSNLSLILLPKALVTKHQKPRESRRIHTFRKYIALATSTDLMTHKRSPCYASSKS